MNCVLVWYVKCSFRVFYRTYNLPHFKDGRVPLGTTGTAGGYQSGQLPNITGTFVGGGDAGTKSGWNISGCFDATQRTGRNGNDGSTACNVTMSASRSSSIYGSYTAVVPSGVYVKYCIKY